MAKLGGLNINRNVQQQNKVAEILDFLKRNYTIKVNDIDESILIKSLTRKYVKPITWKNISVHMLEEGISASDSTLRKIMGDTYYMNTYNPILEYFENLRGKYEGLSHIDILMSHLRAKSFPGKKKDYYQERMYRYMKKWFVATAACVLGLRENDVNMGLVHADEGIGKSFFFDFIVPDELQQYRADPKEDPKKFDFEESFALNFLVYFDELFGIPKRNPELFKKGISAKEIDVYYPREPIPVRKKRIASPCFSSNKTHDRGGFLTSSMSYRRWLVFELESINQEYSKKVNVDQLWAETLVLIEGGYDYAWNIADWTEFKEHNKLYLEETTSAKYLKMHFDFPVNGEGEWLQPREILNMLVTQKKVPREDMRRVSEVKLGEALTTLGFEKKSVRRGDGPRNCYYVKMIN